MRPGSVTILSTKGNVLFLTSKAMCTCTLYNNRNSYRTKHTWANAVSNALMAAEGRSEKMTVELRSASLYKVERSFLLTPGIA